MFWKVRENGREEGIVGQNMTISVESRLASLYDFCLFIYVDIYYESWKLMPLQLKWVINMQPKPSANWKLNRKGEKYLNFVMCFRN